MCFFRLNSETTHFRKYVCMSVFCVLVWRTHFWSLSGHFLYILRCYLNMLLLLPRTAWKGITGLNSCKLKDYGFSKKFHSNPDYTCGSSMKAFHFISSDKQQNLCCDHRYWIYYKGPHVFACPFTEPLFVALSFCG